VKQNGKGHRERLRERFLNNKFEVDDEEFLLELLLTYAIPQRDVKVLAEQLISKYGNLATVLETDFDQLCREKGVKEYSATLLKLVDWIRQSIAPTLQQNTKQLFSPVPQGLFPPNEETFIQEGIKSKYQQQPARRGTLLFAKAVLKETIDILPLFSQDISFLEVKNYLKKNLPYNSEQTRNRYSHYVTNRMFPERIVDWPLLEYAHIFAERQELKDVCFYRFINAEPLMQKVGQDLLLPNMNAGKVERKWIREYLYTLYPQSKSINDCAKAIVDALVAGGLVRASRNSISFSYREISLPSFAFIFYSEFALPGMYNLSDAEKNTFFQLMFWRREDILTSIYELRNQKLLAKVSEIDSVRQFTTSLNLEQVVERLAGNEVER
jgi:ribosomal protein S17E